MIPQPASNQVPGTVSYKVEYWDGTRLILIVHLYLEPGGTLGAGGQPDPKWLLDGGTILTPSHGEPARCKGCATWRPRARANHRDWRWSADRSGQITLTWS
jgi:hypothetical protein